MMLYVMYNAALVSLIVWVSCRFKLYDYTRLRWNLNPSPRESWGYLYLLLLFIAFAVGMCVKIWLTR
jgi:hypothetical protein